MKEYQSLKKFKLDGTLPNLSKNIPKDCQCRRVRSCAHPPTQRWRGTPDTSWTSRETLTSAVFSWHSEHWKMCIPILVAIFRGRQYMASRPPFQLRVALFFWNVVLASFSMFSLLVTLCSADPLEVRQATGLWMYLCILSKMVELGDTAFIVLRKTSLTFLHWYHHVTVVFMVWSTGAYASPMYVYFCLINLLVHCVMYPYYALKVLGIRIPKGISMVITSMQLAQMVAGVVITAYGYHIKAAGHSCPVPAQAVAIAATIYFSYFVLFLDFFLRA